MAKSSDTLTTRFAADPSQFYSELRKMPVEVRKTMADIISTSNKVANDNGLFADVAKSVNKSFGKIDVSHAISSSITKPLKGAAEEGIASAGALGGALEALGPIGIAAGVALLGVGTAMEQAFKGMEYADQIEDTSKKIGITTTQLQELNEVALQVGVSQDALTESLKGGNAALGAYQNGIGDGKIKKVFEQLGITREQARQMSNVTDLLPVLADKIKGLSTAAQTNILKKLGLEEMLPALKNGAASFEDMREEAERLGLVMDSGMVKRGAEANKEIEKLKNMIGMDLKKAFIDLAPVIEGALKIIEKMARGLDDFLSKFKKIQDRSTSALMDEKKGIEDSMKSDPNVMDYVKKNRAEQLAKINAQLATRKTEDAKEDADTKTNTGNTLHGEADDAGKKAAEAAKKAAELKSHSDQAMAEAAKEELAARVALIEDLNKQHLARIDLIKAERDEKNQKLANEVKTGSITGSAASTATALNNKTAQAKIDLENQKAAEDAAARQLSYYNALQTLNIAHLHYLASIAGTAEDWAKEEEDAFKAQQALDLKNNEEQIKEQARKDSTYDAQAARDAFAQKQADEDAAHKHEVAQKEVDMREQALAAMQTYQDRQMQAAAALAKTDKERNDIETQILLSRQETERRLKQEEIEAQTDPKLKAQKQAEYDAMVKAQGGERDAQKVGQRNPMQVYAHTMDDPTKQLQGIGAAGFEGLEKALDSIADKSKTAKQAFSEMAQEMIQQMIKLMIQQAIMKPLMSAFGLNKDSDSSASTADAGVSVLTKAMHYFGFATGTPNAPGGLTRINEYGGELVTLPSGSSVMTAAATKNLMSGSAIPSHYAGGSKQPIVNNTYHVYADNSLVRSDLDRQMMGLTAHGTKASMQLTQTDLKNKQDRRLR